jgi:hypothetical protein
LSLTMTLPDPLELHSLHDWLRHDTTVARETTVSLASSGGDLGEQGALDVIDIILKDATAIGGLAVSIATWQLNRRRKTTVTFRRGTAEVTVDAADAETLAKAIRALPPEDGDDSVQTPRQ